jgi:ribosomal-protein-alanine N-acetyltransferase
MKDLKLKNLTTSDLDLIVENAQKFCNESELRATKEILQLLPLIAMQTRILVGYSTETTWFGYLGSVENELVGTCAFKGPPKNEEVEIAYFTFPEFSGKGYATLMANKLLEIALNSKVVRKVVAHTLAEENASNKILKNIGMHFAGEQKEPTGGQLWRWEKAL